MSYDPSNPDDLGKKVLKYDDDPADGRYVPGLPRGDLYERHIVESMPWDSDGTQWNTDKLVRSGVWSKVSANSEALNTAEETRAKNEKKILDARKSADSSSVTPAVDIDSMDSKAREQFNSNPQAFVEAMQISTKSARKESTVTPSVPHSIPNVPNSPIPPPMQGASTDKSGPCANC